MNVLVVNAGSSSLKFRLFHKESFESISSGEIEEIGAESSPIKYQLHETQEEKKELEAKKKVDSHGEAFKVIMDLLTKGTIEGTKDKLSPVIKGGEDLLGVGHRVVHGGWEFKTGAVIDEDVVEKIKKVSGLAPLHNKANLKGIEEAKEAFGEVNQVASFDTCYHQTIPDHAYMYAIPYHIYQDKKVRKYGFHGTSHYYLAKKGAEILGKKVEECNFVTLHLGNGASACAIKSGRSIDTTMGLTPAEGLMMGTRAGDMDPTATFHMTDGKFDPEKLETLLNKESGFKGICGQSDVREVQKMADEEKDKDKKYRAELALRMFTYKIQKTIGSYFAVLEGKVDGVIFGGGIGEHAPRIRKSVMSSLGFLGMELDDGKNDNAKSDENGTIISEDKSRVKVMVIPTNEELEIAKEVVRLLTSSS